MPTYLVAATAVAAVIYIVTVLRISSFRVDRQESGRRSYFAWPTTSMREVLSPSTYTRQGRRLYPLLVVSWLLFAVLAVVFGIKLLNRPWPQ